MREVRYGGVGMKAPFVLASAAIFACCLGAPAAFAQGHGHGGGHAGGGGRSSGSHGPGPSGSSAGRTTPGPQGTTARPAREHGPRPAAGTAVRRNGSPADLFLATPFTYAPLYFVPSSYPFATGFGYRSFGVSPLSWAPAYSYGGSSWTTICAADIDCSPFASAYAEMPPPGEPAPLEGNIRIDVEPDTAQIFVDGYFVGTVADFRESLAGLNVAAGLHRLEFRAPGYDTLSVDVRIDANRTITYRAVLTRRDR